MTAPLPHDPPDWWPNAAHSRFVSVNGLRVHVQRVGEGPLLCCLHGTGAGTFSFAPLVDCLRRQFTCLLLDLPGHAFTTTLPGAPPPDLSLPGVARTVVAVLRALDQRPIGLIGHSAGAAVGWQLLATAPEEATALLGVNAALVPPPALYEWLGAWWMAPLAMQPVVARALSQLARSPGTIASTLAETGSTVPPALLRCYEACAATPRHVQGALSLMARWELRALLERVRERPWPVHLIHGADDPWVRLEQLRRAVHAIAGVTIDVVPGGHLVHEASPELVAARVRALWGGTRS
jgi:magnesium chelatase accessory protein